MKYCTIVSFRQCWGDATPRVDGRLTVPWEIARALHDMVQCANADASMFESMLAQLDPDVQRHIKRATSAYQGLCLRVRFNADMRGPFVLFTDDEPDEATLVTWAKATLTR